jgi:hypothetical protein
VKLEEWPEELSPTSPEPIQPSTVNGRRRLRAAGVDPDDPGHLFTADEWARIVAQAEGQPDAG